MKPVFIIPSLANYGGVKSVCQLVNNMVASGVSAEICVLGSSTEPINYETLGRVSTIEDIKSRLPNPREEKVFIATRWDTLSIARQLAHLFLGSRIAYFVQDFEPDFYEPGSTNETLSRETYRNSVLKVVKSNWLKQRLEVLGENIHVIEGGVDSNIFYPPGKRQKREFSVVSMVRTSSARRNTKFVLEIIEDLVRRSPSIQIALFGEDLDERTLPPQVTCFGVLSEIEVGKLLRRAKIVIDASLFQGWGRPGLEGLLSGALPIVTPFGGITQWATHLQTAILMEPTSSSSWSRAILDYAVEVEPQGAIARSGIELADRFSPKNEAENWLSLLQSDSLNERK